MTSFIDLLRNSLTTSSTPTRKTIQPPSNPITATTVPNSAATNSTVSSPKYTWVEPQYFKESNGGEGVGDAGFATVARWSAADLKKMGLPADIKPENVRLIKNNEDGISDPNKTYVDIYREGPSNSWLRVRTEPQANGELKFVSRDFGADRSNKSVGIQALSIFASMFPGLGTAVGSALGASGTTAAVVGNAAVQGGLAAVGSNGNLNATLRGAAGGAVGGAVGGATNTLTNAGINPTLANIIARTGTGAAGAAIKGGNPLLGAILGNVAFDTGSAQLNPILNWLLKSKISEQFQQPQKRTGP